MWRIKKHQIMGSEKRLQKQQQALLEIAKRQGIASAQPDDFLMFVTEKAAETLAAERVSIWLYDDKHTKIHCVDLYVSNQGRHDKDIELSAVDYPTYFSALAQNRVIAADDAHSHPSTKEFSESYLTPLGIGAMLDAPIRRGGEIIGVVCTEYIGPNRQWMLDEQNFAASVGDMVSLWLELAEHKQAKDELQQAKNNLETRVEERTRELSIAKSEAEVANLAKSEFLSSMSHELRTPMNAILGFGQLMNMDDSFTSEQKGNVQEILKAGSHLLELINEVLDLSKVESGHIDMSLEPVEVCPVVEECLALMITLADKRDIQISHSCLKGVMVWADRMRLKQSLINLLSNAIKYNRMGGSVKLEVKVKDKQQLRILVTDTGPGIANDRRAELFQPFNRLDAEDSEVEGTGIGLTLTRRIVEMMDGTVDMESQVGVGSTFWIEMPLESLAETDHDEHVDDEITAVRNTVEPVPGNDAAQHCVLYIDDNPGNLKLVEQILKRRTHINLLTAHTPALGIELAKTQQPELIMLDINMPGMDGYQVLEVLKADSRLKNIPVVAVTAYAMLRDVERGKAAGFSDYITKPLDVAHLRTLIDKLLGISLE